MKYSTERAKGLETRIRQNIGLLRVHLDSLEAGIGWAGSLSQMATPMLTNAAMLLSDCGALDEVRYRETKEMKE